MDLTTNRSILNLYETLKDYDTPEDYPSYENCEDDIRDAIYYVMENNASYTFDYDKINFHFLWDCLDGGLFSIEELISRIESFLDDIQNKENTPAFDYSWI